MERMAHRLVAVACAALLIAGCGGDSGDPGDTDTGEASAGMGNPASVHCEDNGGRLEIREDAEGNQQGMCVFEDGSECEEWAYFREECAPGSQTG